MDRAETRAEHRQLPLRKFTPIFANGPAKGRGGTDQTEKTSDLALVPGARPSHLTPQPFLEKSIDATVRSVCLFVQDFRCTGVGSHMPKGNEHSVEVQTMGDLGAHTRDASMKQIQSLSTYVERSFQNVSHLNLHILAGIFSLNHRRPSPT